MSNKNEVEMFLGYLIPEQLYEKAEEYAKHKLSIYKENYPDRKFYDNEYLIILTADTVTEMQFSDSTKGV